MIRRPVSFLLLAALLAATPLLAQDADEPDPSAADSTAAPAVLTEFDNGLHLLVLPRPDWKLAWVKADG